MTTPRHAVHKWITNHFTEFGLFVCYVILLLYYLCGMGWFDWCTYALSAHFFLVDIYAFQRKVGAVRSLGIFGPNEVHVCDPH